MRKEDSAFWFVLQVLLLLPKLWNSKVPGQAAACSGQTAKRPARCLWSPIQKGRVKNNESTGLEGTSKISSISWICFVTSLLNGHPKTEFVLSKGISLYMCKAPAMRKILLVKSWPLFVCGFLCSLLPIFLLGCILNAYNSSCLCQFLSSQSMAIVLSLRFPFLSFHGKHCYLVLWLFSI